VLVEADTTAGRPIPPADAPKVAPAPAAPVAAAPAKAVKK
jgi:hypothetical protein